MQWDSMFPHKVIFGARFPPSVRDILIFIERMLTAARRATPNMNGKALLVTIAYERDRLCCKGHCTVRHTQYRTRKHIPCATNVSLMNCQPCCDRFRCFANSTNEFACVYGVTRRLQRTYERHGPCTQQCSSRAKKLTRHGIHTNYAAVTTVSGAYTRHVCSRPAH